MLPVLVSGLDWDNSKAVMANNAKSQNYTCAKMQKVSERWIIAVKTGKIGKSIHNIAHLYHNVYLTFFLCFCVKSVKSSVSKLTIKISTFPTKCKCVFGLFVRYHQNGKPGAKYKKLSVDLFIR